MIEYSMTTYHNVLCIFLIYYFDWLSQPHPNRGECSGRGFHRGHEDCASGRYKFQCHTFLKTGHDVGICYHRHSSMMPCSWNAPQKWPNPSPGLNHWTGLTVELDWFRYNFYHLGFDDSKLMKKSK